MPSMFPAGSMPLPMTQSERTTGHGGYIPYLLLLGDILVVNIVFLITIFVFPALKNNPRILRELWVLVEVGLIPMLAIIRRLPVRGAKMEITVRKALTAVGAHALLFLCLRGFLEIAEMSLRAIVFFYASLVTAETLYRITAGLVLKHFRRKGYNFVRVVIVGTGPSACRLFNALQQDAGFGFYVLGFFDDNPPEGFNLGAVYPIDSLADFVKERDVRQIYFSLSGHDKALNQVIKAADDNVAEFFYVPQLPHTMNRPLHLTSVREQPVLRMGHNPLKSSVNRFIKRSFDIAFSSVFLCFYPLVYIPVAITIKLTSPGPVYFKQERTGYMGKTFLCYKFRTMHVNRNADTCQATKNDPRKTKFGDLLRRTSIDELPQFINVLKGDMSIVGPRPHMLKHTEDYTRLVDHYMVRHAVKPGITGWAQVNGYRGLTDQLWKMERRVEHDVWYIENWSFLLDLKIIVRTVMNAVAGEKNAF